MPETAELPVSYQAAEKLRQGLLDQLEKDLQGVDIERSWARFHNLREERRLLTLEDLRTQIQDYLNALRGAFVKIFSGVETTTPKPELYDRYMRDIARRIHATPPDLLETVLAHQWVTLNRLEEEILEELPMSEKRVEPKVNVSKIVEELERSLSAGLEVVPRVMTQEEADERRRNVYDYFTKGAGNVYWKALENMLRAWVAQLPTMEVESVLRDVFLRVGGHILEIIVNAASGNDEELFRKSLEILSSALEELDRESIFTYASDEEMGFMGLQKLLKKIVWNEEKLEHLSSEIRHLKRVINDLDRWLKEEIEKAVRSPEESTELEKLRAIVDDLLELIERYGIPIEDFVTNIRSYIFALESEKRHKDLSAEEERQMFEELRVLLENAVADSDELMNRVESEVATIKSELRSKEISRWQTEQV